MEPLVERLWDEVMMITGFGGVPGLHNFVDAKYRCQLLAEGESPDEIHAAAVRVDQRVRAMREARDTGNMDRLWELGKLPITDPEPPIKQEERDQ